MPFPESYLAAWSTALALSVITAVRCRRELELFGQAYWRWLATPWRLVTFFLAALPLVFFAPFSGDPTWDFADASFMSVLTFATAPWFTAVLFQTARRRASLAKLYVALCVWLLSASWSYDLYIYLRDGAYPPTFLVNIPASSVLYLAGGLFWSLDWRAERGVHFAFTDSGWPRSNKTMDYRKLLLFGLPFMLLYALVFVVAWMGMG